MFNFNKKILPSQLNFISLSFLEQGKIENSEFIEYFLVINFFKNRFVVFRLFWNDFEFFVKIRGFKSDIFMKQNLNFWFRMWKMYTNGWRMKFTFWFFIFELYTQKREIISVINFDIIIESRSSTNSFNAPR